MVRFTTLQISGYRDQPVPNTYIRQDGDTRHLAIIFPGWGYTADMPVLYYPGRLLLAQGADVLLVEYDYNRQPGWGSLSDVEQGRWLMDDIRAACNAGLAQRSYDQFTLVGKSLGTMAMGNLLTTDDRFAQAQAIWLTPTLRYPPLRSQMKQARQRGILVIGTADSYYDPAFLDELKKESPTQVVLVDGGDHSLEIGDEVVKTIQAMAEVIRAMQAFLHTR